MNPLNSQKGFALVAAIMAMMVLTAVGLLAFALSTQDIRISSRLVGEKKAFSAVEAGTHRFVQNFNPTNLNASAVPLPGLPVDAGNDPTSLYTVGVPQRGVPGRPATLPLPGFAIGGGQQWGQELFEVAMAGMNTRYQTSLQMNTGAGYGPIEITTTYR
jgi:hypothetical protein